MTRYVYDGDGSTSLTTGQIVAECDVNGVTETYLRRYIYGPGIDEPVAMRRITGGVGKWYYYHYDGLGSVVALSDSSGKLVEKYSYDVFGSVTIRDPLNAIRSSSAYGNSRMFTGRDYDDETGLYYYRARYYSPAIGRFMSADPLGTVPDGGERNPFVPVARYAGGLNLYTYIDNNPINWTDPLGLFVFYGRYCGGGSKGGEPRDELDRACKNHDDCYKDCGRPGGILGCLLPSHCKRNCDMDLCVNAHFARCKTYRCKYFRNLIRGLSCYNSIRTF